MSAKGSSQSSAVDGTNLHVSNFKKRWRITTFNLNIFKKISATHIYLYWWFLNCSKSKIIIHVKTVSYNFFYNFQAFFDKLTPCGVT